MSTVQIVPNKDTSALVTPYAGNPQYGYIQLTQNFMDISGGWLRTKTKSCLVRGEVKSLSEWVRSLGGKNVVTGSIVTREYLESEVPEDVMKRYIDDSKTYEEAIASYVKRSGKDGIELTLGGERILRFSEFDGTGESSDVVVAHDNITDVAAHRESLNAVAKIATKSEKTATLPA